MKTTKFILSSIVAVAFISCKNDETATIAVPQPISISKQEAQASAPINVTVNGYRVTAGGFTLPSPGENQLYDYSNITQGSAISYKMQAAANANFPTATYTDTLRNTIGIGSTNNSVLETRYFEINDSEWKLLGSVANGLAATVIPGVGTVSYASPLITRENPGYAYAKFPLTYGKIFSSNSVSTLPFTVNAALVAPVPVPGETRDSTKSFKTVMGWGKIKLKGYATEMECLMMKTEGTVKRNYFLTNSNGEMAAAPTALLQTVGLTDGVVTPITTFYEFWVKGKGVVCYINANGSGIVYTTL
jgi:hypothetical protein